MSATDNSGKAILNINAIQPILNQELLQDYKGEREAFIQVGQHKTFLHKKYKDVAQDILNFKVRPDDIWVITFPRSGTTLTQEMAWQIINDVNIEASSTKLLAFRVPHLEINTMINDVLVDEIAAESEETPDSQKLILDTKMNFLSAIDQMPSPRVIKCHLHFDLLPKDLLTCGAKVIYVARNPKDVAVSCYHLNKTIRYLGYTGDFAKYWDYFERGLTLWAPYWPHVIGGWERRKNPNLLFLFYEDLNRNMKNSILKVCNFLNKKLSDEQLTKLMDHLQFDNFKNNPSVNYDVLFKMKAFNSDAERFVRKGKVGGWVDEFTPELSARADKWIEENLKKTDMRFPV